jgi:hypothetical protein
VEGWKEGTGELLRARRMGVRVESGDGDGAQDEDVIDWMRETMNIAADLKPCIDEVIHSPLAEDICLK